MILPGRFQAQASMGRPLGLFHVSQDQRPPHRHRRSPCQRPILISNQSLFLRQRPQPGVSSRASLASFLYPSPSNPSIPVVAFPQTLALAILLQTLQDPTPWLALLPPRSSPHIALRTPTYPSYPHMINPHALPQSQQDPFQTVPHPTDNRPSGLPELCPLAYRATTVMISLPLPPFLPLRSAFPAADQVRACP